jgi:uncharacterized glyoxalase superfamily protein PhnB
MLKAAVPVLHVSSSAAAEEFYCEQLGFSKQFAYHGDDAKPDPCYMGISRDDAWIFVSSFPGDAVVGGVVYLKVDDVDQHHEELIGRGVAIDLEPTDQTWGNREMYVKDPDGNCLRFVREGEGG